MLGWQPEIGDPGFWGWFTVAAYFAAGLLCFRAFRLSGPPKPPTTRRAILDARVARRFWLVAALLLCVLGVNKQMDLQSLLTAIGRALANDQGWYESRRSVQQVFIGAIAILAGAILIAALWAFRRGGVWVQVGQFGLITLCAFVILRAASFHHIDLLLASPVGFLKFNHAMELGGIAIIASAAVAASVRSGRRA